MALVGAPLLLLIVVGVMVGDVLLNARAAYQSIFVPSAPRPVVTVNAQGTPVIVPNVTAAAEQPDWTGKARINILLLGADTNQARKASGEPALSDTIIIASIDPVARTVGMMSIPRDTLVPIPGVGNDKINAAFSNGELSAITGPGLVRATVEYNFHIPIQYYAQVDFAGFEKIVDTLGGVTVDVPAPLKDDQYPGQAFNYTRVYFHTGLQHLDGVTALNYVRTRHDDNDFARGDRQRQVLVALRQQGVKLNLLPKASELIAELGNTVRTDIPPGDLLRLARLGTEIHTADIKSYSLLPALTEDNSPLGYYLIPDWAKVAQIVNQMIPPAPPPTPTPAPTATAAPASTPVQSAGQSAGGQSDLGARILVENGTHVDKLAARSATKLGDAGFTDVTTAQAADAGQHPTSQVISYSPNLATARLVAQTLGLPASAVVAGDPARANGYAVVAMLGDDAPTSSASTGP